MLTAHQSVCQAPCDWRLVLLVWVGRLLCRLQVEQVPGLRQPHTHVWGSRVLRVG